MQASHEYLRCTQLVEINFEVVEGVSKISRLINGRFTTISSHVFGHLLTKLTKFHVKQVGWNQFKKIDVKCELVK